jgi:hypothetical protein
MFVDYNNVEQSNIGIKPVVIIPNEYNEDYDDTTRSYYKSLRLKKTDPITYEKLTDDNAFKFPYMWDPYTGIRSDQLDPNGPLYFNPITLLLHIYHSRLKTLWLVMGGDEDNDNRDNDGYEDEEYEDNYFEGYGEGVGAGENFEIIGRGIYPEHHIFRLPVADCYLKKTHSMSLITMGPILNSREICELDRLIKKHWTHCKEFNTVYQSIGSIYKLKCYYDIAIAKKPSLMDLSCIEVGNKNFVMKHEDPDLYLNRTAVDALRRMDINLRRY